MAYPAGDSKPVQLIRFNDLTGDMEVIADGGVIEGRHELDTAHQPAHRRSKSSARQTPLRAAPRRFELCTPPPPRPAPRPTKGLRGGREAAARDPDADRRGRGCRARAHGQVLHPQPAARPERRLPARAQPPPVHQGALDVVAAHQAHGA